MSVFGERRGVYHSEMVRESENGLIVKFTGKPIESKYKEGEYFIPFTVQEDGEKKTYTIENGDIHTYLSHVPQDEWVQLFAYGSRDSATIVCHDKQGDDVVDQKPGDAQSEWPDDDGPPPNEWPDPTTPDETDDGPPPNEWPDSVQDGPEIKAVRLFRTIYPDIFIEVQGSVQEGDDIPYAAIVDATRVIVNTLLMHR